MNVEVVSAANTRTLHQEKKDLFAAHIWVDKLINSFLQCLCLEEEWAKNVKTVKTKYI